MSETPTIDSDSIGTEPASGDESGMLDIVPDLGLSRRQVALLVALVVMSVAVYKLRQRDGDMSEAAAEVAEAREREIGDVKVSEDEDADGVEVVVPADPANELEKDEAVVDMLAEAGHIERSDGD
ncbi:putative protein 12 [Haloarcula hispanica icosahedral virus 2]|uniref:Uncharacterized protein n=1 Tax=Haloarcula hispanica icosahedral virus 2 TaxID=1154689 RepID=H9AZW8_9VIRU|nr:putative protein 12 [Haloarcula hispanica icosahedral virus 2]AFD02293.1 putative protein 12 [Haloarcula hispanica icosahedral virus 2]